eukprot:2940776-Rhodomonas_salina.3
MPLPGESTGVLPAFIVEEAKRKAEGKGSIVGDTMERKAKKIVRRVVKVMSEDPLKYCSVRSRFEPFSEPTVSSSELTRFRLHNHTHLPSLLGSIQCDPAHEREQAPCV